MCESMEQLRNEGIAEGMKEGRLMTMIEMVSDGILSLKEAALRLEMPEQELLAKMCQVSERKSERNQTYV